MLRQAGLDVDITNNKIIALAYQTTDDMSFRVRLYCHLVDMIITYLHKITLKEQENFLMQLLSG